MQNYFYILDLEVYGLDDKMWAAPTLYTKSTLKLRRNHVALLVGKKLLFLFDFLRAFSKTKILYLLLSVCVLFNFNFFFASD